MGRVGWVAAVAVAGWITFGLLHARYVAGAFGVVAICALLLLVLQRFGVTISLRRR